MAFLFGLQDTLLDFFEKGGGVVVFIGFLIILMWSFILERFWYFKYIHADVEKDIQNAWKETSDRKSWSGHQIRSMLISKANVKIQSNLEYIRVAIVLAPLLGLLGTILGMIEVFHILAVTGGGDAKAMAGGHQPLLLHHLHQLQLRCEKLLSCLKWFLTNLVMVLIQWLL